MIRETFGARASIVVATVTAVVCATAPLTAQTSAGTAAPGGAPSAAIARPARTFLRRPKLFATADTNDALAYFFYARSQLNKNPRDAADAFYWAMRIAPLWQPSYYGRAAALMIQNPEATIRSFRSDDEPYLGVAVADSLRTTAELINPLAPASTFNWDVLTSLWSYVTHGEGWIPENVTTGDPSFDAWMYETQGNMPAAAKQYATAIKRRTKNYTLHASRGAVFVQLGQLDSALYEYNLYLEGARKRDTTKLVRFFRPQALGEYSLGEVNLLRADTAAAKAAFESALVEDLSFYMGHVRLGELAAARGDSATTVNEFETALQLKDDAMVHFRYAQALLVIKQQPAALKHFQATIQLEPYFAMPYFYAGRIYDSSDYGEDAIKSYTDFLARASHTFTESAWVTNRLAELKAASQPATTGSTGSSKE